MSESAAHEQTPETEQGSDSPQEQPLAESAESPERVEHTDVTEHDEVDPTALDIAESTSSDEPPA